MADAGEVVSRQKAVEIENAGVSVATSPLRKKEVKIISNGMVDISGFVIL